MNDILGVHYLIGFYDCDENYLISVFKIKDLMINAGKIGNFNVVKSCFHQYLSLIHIRRCRRTLGCRTRWSPYH